MGLFPLIPRPMEPKSTCKLFEPENAKATQTSWSSNRLPIDLAFSPGDLLCAGPKKSSLNLFMLVKHPGGMLSGVRWKIV
jgi:hypothetical protein